MNMLKRVFAAIHRLIVHQCGGELDLEQERRRQYQHLYEAA